LISNILCFFCGFLGCHVPLANLDSPTVALGSGSRRYENCLDFLDQWEKNSQGLQMRRLASWTTLVQVDSSKVRSNDAPVVRPWGVPLQTWLAGKSTIDERAFTIKTSMYKGFSIATFDDRKSICYYPLHILKHI